MLRACPCAGQWPQSPTCYGLVFSLLHTRNPGLGSQQPAHKEPRAWVSAACAAYDRVAQTGYKGEPLLRLVLQVCFCRAWGSYETLCKFLYSLRSTKIL